MSLELIVGPPNSGRAGEVLTRLKAALESDPLLVVPAGDDVARFERDLCADGSAAIGATIRTFASLVDEIAAAGATSVAPPLSAPARLALIRAAVDAASLRALRRSAGSRGFAGALDLLIAELQAALVTPRDLRAGLEEVGDGHERELADLYAAYLELRERSGRADAGTLAAAAARALRENRGPWGGRPVFVYGFDDLTEAQLELLELLAKDSTVTVAVNYADRRALAARAGMLARLRQELGGTVVAELDFDDSYTERPSLRRLDRELFEPEAEPVAPDGGVELLECAGERGEAEAVALQIARLLDGGARADEIVVALRRPDVDGPLFATVLGELGVPAALEADLPLARTAVGRALLSLCRAAGAEGEPEDLLAHLRADPSLPAGAIDWAERALARGEAEGVDGLVAGWASPPVHLQRVREARDAASRVGALARSARDLAERAHRESAPLAGERAGGVPLDPIELRAGMVAAELLDELALVGALPGCSEPDLSEAAEAIESASVRAWRGSAEGRVRIVSPYRVRAGRARYLFCAALQEGVFPGSGPTDPLLGEETRSALGIAALRRQEQADEERYLFHVCVSRPVERLYLSWRASDDEGHPVSRSPFVDEVLDLLGEDPAQAEDAVKRSRGLGAVVANPGEASTPRTLARSLALRFGREPAALAAALGALELESDVRAQVGAAAQRIPAPGRLPGPLCHPRVLDELGSRELLSAGSLEGWVECSYRWFVNHELTPQRLEPEPDPLWLGAVVHDALYELYREAPGDDSIPRPGDVERWKRRFGELLAAVCADPERPAPPPPARRMALARLRLQVEAFLDEEARSETDLRPDPDLLERGFGFDEEEGDPGALDLGEFALRGRIDRVDVAPGGGAALLRDYKTSTKVTGRKAFADKGKLQLQLYMLAARTRLGLEPAGGVYHPLGASGDRRPRGLLRADEPALDGLATVGGDPVGVEEFEDELERAKELAIHEGGRMRAGDITRDPLGGRCARYCEFQSICRLERSLGLGDDEGEPGE